MMGDKVLKVKVCGLTQLPQIQELILMKVDFLGFIFYEKSPRYVLSHLSLEDISKIDHQGKTGVFVNETIENIIEIAEKAKLNFIQLHGNEDEEFIKRLRQRLSEEVKIIKVMRIGNQTLENLQQAINHIPSTINYLLFDTDSKAFGGTGQTFDWKMLNDIEINKPYFLSGGISLENFQHLSTINQQPFALDINSKFEIEPGIKDIEKITKFLIKVKNEI